MTAQEYPERHIPATVPGLTPELKSCRYSPEIECTLKIGAPCDPMCHLVPKVKTKQKQSTTNDKQKELNYNDGWNNALDAIETAMDEDIRFTDYSGETISLPLERWENMITELRKEKE